MSNKVYVDVLAEFSKDGLLIPKEITWEDGRKYEITRVKDKRRGSIFYHSGIRKSNTLFIGNVRVVLYFPGKPVYKEQSER